MCSSCDRTKVSPNLVQHKEEDSRKVKEADLAMRVRMQEERQRQELLARQERQRAEEARRREMEAKKRRKREEAEAQLRELEAERREAEQKAKEAEEKLREEQAEQERAAKAAEDKEKLDVWMKNKNLKEVNSKKSLGLFSGSVFPLHIAVREKDAEMVNILLANGADPTSVNSLKWTPLQLAERLAAKDRTGAYDAVLAALK